MRQISAHLAREMTKPAEIRALLPRAEAQFALAALDEAERRCAPAEAVELTGRLLSLYPQREDGVPDPQAYASGLAATLARFSVAAARLAVSLEKGLPARSRYRPSIAELVEACEAEAKRLRDLRRAAQWMLEERERREAAQREAASRAAARRLTEEELARLLAPWRGGGAGE
jgi:hypothetical protein